jgi:hypothetical protein
MNTNTLAKQYDKLTPLERVPMMLAAEARGDRVEMLRLGQSAPRREWKIADCYGLDQGLLWAAAVQMMVQLDLVESYSQVTMLLETGSTVLKKKTNDRLYKTLQMVAFRIVQGADAWKLFCAGLNIDPVWLLRDLPGFKTVKRIEEEARPVAFNPTQALAYLRQKLDLEKKAKGEPPCEVVEFSIATAETIAKTIREGVERYMIAWQ